MEILDGRAFGQGIIARANQLAEAERWNVPQVRDSVQCTLRIRLSRRERSQRRNVAGS